MNQQTNLFKKSPETMAKAREVMSERAFDTYREHHGEAPSKEAEARRKPLRTAKAKVVLDYLKTRNGMTAGEMWYSWRSVFEEHKIRDIYDLRRTLSMLKKMDEIRSGEPRQCKILGVNTYPWFLT